jgi:hypothetical protein
MVRGGTTPRSDRLLCKLEVAAQRRMAEPVTACVADVWQTALEELELPETGRRAVDASCDRILHRPVRLEAVRLGTRREAGLGG